MSEVAKPRIPRGPAPDCVLTPRNCREEALPPLRRDSKDRCAYSMQHLRFAGGLTCMEVDHFDPRKKNDPVQDYDNLFLASRHCNRAKGTFWPTD
jgi:5-methylcytosine-specific restriction endonuclease McrA